MRSSRLIPLALLLFSGCRRGGPPPVSPLAAPPRAATPVAAPRPAAPPAVALNRTVHPGAPDLVLDEGLPETPFHLLAARYSADGRLIAILGDRTLQLRDASDGALRGEVLLPAAGREVLWAGPARVVVANTDGELLVWALERNEVERLALSAGVGGQPQLGNQGFPLLAGSADGRRVFARLERGAVAWDLQTRTVRSFLLVDELGGAVAPPAISPDGSRLALVDGAGGVVLFDVDTGSRLARIEPDPGLPPREEEAEAGAGKPAGPVPQPLTAAALSGRGELAVGGAAGVVRFCDATTGRPLRSGPKFRHAVAALAFRPDGGELAVGLGSAPAGDEEDSQEEGLHLVAAAAGAAPRPVAGIFLEEGRIEWRDPARLTIVYGMHSLPVVDAVAARVVHQSHASWFAASPDGRRALACAGTDSPADLVTIPPGAAPVATLPRREDLSRTHLSLAERAPRAAWRVPGRSLLVDLARGRVLGALDAWDVALHPGGGVAATVERDRLALLDLAAAAPPRTVAPPPGVRPERVAFSPNGAYLVLLEGGGRAVGLRWPSLAPAGALPGGSSAVFSPDDGQRARIDMDASPRTIEVFAVAGGARRLVAPVDQMQGFAAAWSADGRTVALPVAGQPYVPRVRLAEAQSGRTLVELDGVMLSLFAPVAPPGDARLAVVPAGEAPCIYSLAARGCAVRLPVDLLADTVTPFDRRLHFNGPGTRLARLLNGSAPRLDFLDAGRGERTRQLPIGDLLWGGWVGPGVVVLAGHRLELFGVDGGHVSVAAPRRTLAALVALDDEGRFDFDGPPAVLGALRLRGPGDVRLAPLVPATADSPRRQRDLVPRFLAAHP